MAITRGQARLSLGLKFATDVIHARCSIASRPT
jgi:hypothetical protein